MNRFRLCFVTDTFYLRGKDWKEWIGKCIDGGVDMVQLRDKEATTRDLICRAKQLKVFLEPLGVPLIINDRVDVAMAVSADGVHLGNEDMPFEEARRLLGKEAVIGLSVESFEDVHRANEQDAAYLGISSLYQTATKTNLRCIWGLEGLRQIRQISSHHLMAIGGIDETNISPLKEAGADSVAVVSCLCRCSDPTATARELLQHFIGEQV